MKMKKAMLVLIFEASMVLAELSHSSACLMKKQLYHEETKACFPPLDQGPCMAGEWLVLASASGTSTGVCSQKFVCETGERPFLYPAGGAVCGCMDGKEKFVGSCETLYSQSVCRKGQVLLLDKFVIGHHICPGQFSCKTTNDCRAFQAMKPELAPTGTKRRKEQQNFLQDLICDKNTRSVCCPDYDRESLFTPSNLIQSMLPQEHVCAVNPCPAGKWPWVGTDGICKCLYRDDTIDNCQDVIVEENGRLECQIFATRSVVPIFKRNCGRRRRKIHGRCVRLF